MTLWKWSRTAASNDTSDLAAPGLIDWREGQSPATVNDSSRGVMAAVAKYRDDTSGLLFTDGATSASAYIITNTFQVLAATPPHGHSITFIPTITNAASVTLRVDGGTTFPIQYQGAAVGAAQLIAGTPYTATFSQAVSAWLLNNVYAGATPFIVPLGALLPYAGASAPSSNFALCLGQELSRTVLYGPLFALLGVNYGAGNGSTTFNIPDLQGRVPAGIDGTGTRLTSATMTPNGNTRGATGGNTERYTLAINDTPNHVHGVFLNDPQHSHQLNDVGTGFNNGTISSTLLAAGAGLTGVFTKPNSTGITVRDTAGGGGIANQTAGVIGLTAANSINMIQPTQLFNFIIRIL